MPKGAYRFFHRFITLSVMIFLIGFLGFASSAEAHTITSSVAVGTGTISPLGATTVGDGANQDFVITPGTGWHVDTVVVDGSPIVLADHGIDVDTGGTYSFTNVTTDHTITANYAIDTFTITTSTTGTGTITDPDPVVD